MFSCVRTQKSCSREEINAFYADVSQWKQEIVAELARNELSPTAAYTKACTDLSHRMRTHYPKRKFEDLIQGENSRAGELFAKTVNSVRH